ncbi:hypothetical protein GCM10010213_25110 [Microbacterium maritypicum]|uniref:Uncharacterized protein n=1 Tax=Microbacterium maritypicum TaxID=33918 RepID=A0A4Y4B7F1_MICMQ|nr:hypothetical protein MLI01_26460 [Microbacterium liquefaciens]GGV61424.1 hypothetical protein GCM10010213_25110 [Microbacterium liquefaciens]
MLDPEQGAKVTHASTLRPRRTPGVDRDGSDLQTPVIPSLQEGERT